MRSLSFERFEELYDKGTHIPVFKEILADMETPVGVLRKFLETEHECFLLESVEHGENIARYSFLGVRPTAVLYSIDGRTTIVDRVSGKEHTHDTPILDVIDGMLAEVSFVDDRDFNGCINGFVGFLSFENVSEFEDITFRDKKREHTYDSIFFRAETLIAFDHISRRLRVIKVVAKTGNARADYDAAVAEIDTLIAVVHTPQAFKPLVFDEGKKGGEVFRPCIPKKKFIQDIQAVKDYIKNGDAIQVVYSQRFALGEIKNPFNVYRTLRTINPSPYMFYFQYHDTILIGSSPELLVKKEKNKAIIRPIAGTRQRGRNEAEDKKREEELRKSPKENAEHLMLVDLSRNDIGQVCKYGSVRVEKLAYVERYSHVMHLVSNVEGTLRSNKNSISLLKATFPAGTVSGAPKIRAMQIIDELEPLRRGPYAGSLGHIGFCGDMGMCIMIRTIFIDKGYAYLQAGAGIVYDSNPEKEYEETINKATAAFRAIEMAQTLDEQE